ncbi:type IV secretion system protein VirB7 [Helicobacter pylori]|nr:type IV secretion system protein VirB7 [Helicobacter pylori]MDU9726298.1 type IV secretion system protein VirB7 [Helicobacter pylori]MDU9777363.1 type IV secretion system protein VirB7 [Helicobacter pylori]RVY45385.1 type IV secretion system protein VirB7 [Helicobacter pylori]RVZ61182.1 type IV secretion system protein VirB7 [Helicobacter pylori]WQW27486.1 type IV secretion system protein VirB7 [Helicobacter pylori]
MKNIMRLVFVIVAMFLCACSEKFIEMKKSPCALNAPMMQGGLYV